MAPEEPVWSSWLTAQQIADLTGLGGDFGGNSAEFVEACVRDLAAGMSPVVSGHPCGREIRLVKGGFETQAKDDDRWIRVRSLNEAIEAHKHPERFPVIVGASSDAGRAGGVEAFDWGA